MMISCKKAAELTCQSLDRRLSIWERTKLHFHLAMCRGCAAFRKQSLKLDELIARRFHADVNLSEQELREAIDRLPEETCQRMKQRLREALNQS